jgi:PAS domain S-box-containing protein
VKRRTSRRLTDAPSRRSAKSSDVTRKRGPPGQRSSLIDLGIADRRVPLHSHIACLWETEQDFAEAVGFVETGLRGSDHCVVIGNRADNERILAILEGRGLDVDALQTRGRLTVLERAPKAQAMLDDIGAVLDGMLAAGANLVRLSGNVGWDRKAGPSDAELLAYEARLTEIAQEYPCVVLCLHPVHALTGLIARRGVFHTHPQMLEEADVLENPFFVPFERFEERLEAVTAQLSKGQDEREATRRQREILQAIFDNIPVMISFVDPSGRLLLVNREWERVLGWSFREGQGYDFLAEAYPDPESRREVLEFMQKAEQRWQDFRTRTKDGRIIDTSWLRVGLSNGTRIGFGLDLTERKRLEKGIRTSEALLSEGERLAHTGSWVLNLDSGKLFWSAESFRIFGLEPDGAAPPLFFGLQPADYSAAEIMVHPEDRPALQTAVARALAGKRDFEANHRVVRANGTIRFVHSVGHPIPGESGEIREYVGVIMDVTEQALARESLQRSHDELRLLSERLRTVREEERTRLAREVHDEIGQALTALQMDVAWLEKKLATSPETARESGVEKLKSMSVLLDTTLGAVQRIAADLRPGVLDELGLEAATEWYVRDFESRTGIVCHLQADLKGAPVEAGLATAVFRILQEALTNVARHSGAGRVEIHLSADTNELRLEIRDDGRGIPNDQVAASQSLGLLGMRERALSLGGDLLVRGIPDVGTTVTLRLPR